MQQTSRRFSSKYGLLSLLMLLLWAVIVDKVLAVTDFLPMDGQKIITASSVHMREQPAMDAEVVAQLALGTVVTASQRSREPEQTGGSETDYWYFVQSANATGWVAGSMLQDFDPVQQEQLWFRLIKARLDNPDLSFADRVELNRFAVQVYKQAKDEKLQGAFALAELLTLQKAFDLVSFENESTEPYRSWVDEHLEADAVFHDEISGQWLVPADDYWDLADDYVQRPGSDEIAWYAANARLGGECEGDISCNLERERRTQGEYLQRFPYGRYAAVSLDRMSEVLDYVLKALAEDPGYFAHASESLETVDALVDIIANTNPKLTERAKAFGQIKAIRQAAISPQPSTE